MKNLFLNIEFSRHKFFYITASRHKGKGNTARRTSQYLKNCIDKVTKRSQKKPSCIPASLKRTVYFLRTT